MLRALPRSIFSWNFDVYLDRELIAEATKTAMVRVFEVRWAGESYTLRAASALTRRFVIEQRAEVVGGIGPDHPFTRRNSIHLPEGMPAEVGVFMFWLVALMWRRSQNAAAAS